jgi:23S rRNA pseudouridine1911/1915/1917 synthase
MRQRIKIRFEDTQAQRLDKYLSDLRIQGSTAAPYRKAHEEDRVLVNLFPVKKSYLLQAGDEVDISLPEPEPQEIVPQDIPLEVVYEDEHLAIINKEPGLIVHPGFGNPDRTLVNAILFRWGSELSSGRAPDRPGIVHRLDSGTSGLMIIAKNDMAHRAN